MLSIIMYHYVRDLPHTRYPEIKGLLTADFEGQLDYITRYYKVCSLQDVVAALHGQEPLPDNACLLTFDDGLLDHYLTVFPRLVKRGLTGSFYVPAMPIVERRVLDVHKIHFILAAAEQPEALVEDVYAVVNDYRAVYDLPDNETLYRTASKPSRYDSPAICFIKGALQYGLPESVRLAAVEKLFSRYVTTDEMAFANELYVDTLQLQVMLEAGMEICGHGYNHVHLGKISDEEQAIEVEQTITFLSQIYGAEPIDWTMSYPYGSYNETTLALLQQTQCALGLAVNVGIVKDLSKPFELSRINTNDLPTSADIPPVSWTTAVLNR